jgi:hypothetical protein
LNFYFRKKKDKNWSQQPASKPRKIEKHYHVLYLSKEGQTKSLRVNKLWPRVFIGFFATALFFSIYSLNYSLNLHSNLDELNIVTQANMELKDKYCNNLSNYSRFVTREVKIGDLPMGGENPIRIQSDRIK